MQSSAKIRVKIVFAAPRGKLCIGNGSFFHPAAAVFYLRTKIQRKLRVSKRASRKKSCRYVCYLRTMYKLQHIIRKLLSSRIQLSHCYASEHIEGVLESVVNCIPWRWKMLWWTNLVFLDASSHLYKRVCPSVGRSVGWSVMLCDAFVKNARKSFISPILSLPFSALDLFMPF